VIEASPRPPDVTRLLQEWRSGRQEALDRLIRVVYAELRRMARGQLAREGHRHTLQPTELVHEVFLRLGDQKIWWQNRAHFYGIAATCMRRVLVDYARRKRALKRPPPAAAVDVDDAVVGAPTSIDTVIAIDQALDRLAEADEECARVAELKLFGGLEIDEIAEVRGISRSTVNRKWSAAKKMLSELLAERGRDAR
jgi:RNA polymerase sigma factor (TIGR02999 family)